MDLEAIRAKIAAKKAPENREPEPDQWEISEEELLNVGEGKAASNVRTLAPSRAQGSAALPAPVQQQARVLLETEPRSTVLKLFKLPLDTEYTFNVGAYKGEHYIDSCRQIISRARKQARDTNTPILPCKVLVMGLEHKPGYDEVKLIRTQSSSLKQRAMYDDLLEVMGPPKT